MEKDNRFKLRLSRMFRSSFGSCRSRNISDVIERPVFVPSDHLPPPSPPLKPRPFPSICPDPTRTVNNACIVSAVDVARRSASRVRQKVTEHPPPRLSHVRFCTPSSPLCPSPFYDKTEKMKKRSAVKKKKKTTKRKNRRRPPLSSPSTTTPYDYYGGGDWFSSDDEREDDGEVDTLFSSRSTFSSDEDSSPSRVNRHNKHRRRRSRRSKSTSRRRTAKKDDILPLNESKYEIKDSFAVVKRSSDPYSDFRTSMVEMIVERQIFGRAELEKLLQCFLALNSVHHHATIVEVFREIRETLFSDLYC